MDISTLAGQYLGKARNVIMHQQDVMLALFVILIISVFIIPLPRFLLDALLCVSIALSIFILLSVLFIESPAAFSSFPMVVLLATLVRLALNIASTRLILANGHEGEGAAGKVIDAFANLLIGHSFIIGAIIFAILVVVNFVVITKGSSRIAEVSARFTLDAMPGKQMAIDADLSNGLITEAEARARRQDLEAESAFFGAMDGAAKFVRGDAIAALFSTFINIVGGIAIGVGQRNLSFAEAAENFTRLTIGDGLVTQIPAIIVSAAAGIIVTKSNASQEKVGNIFFQLFGHTHALVMAMCIFLILCILPGMPFLPFFSLAALCGVVAWKRRGAGQGADETSSDGDAGSARGADAGSEVSPRLDDIKLELGYNLLHLVNNVAEGLRITEQVKMLRRQLVKEFGFVMPSIRIQDNMQLAADAYVIRIREIEVGRGEIRPQMSLVIDPKGNTLSLAGEATTEPAFGLPAVWVDATEREEAIIKGHTVVDPSTVITTHLSEIIKDNMADLFSHVQAFKLLNSLENEEKNLVNDLVPSQLAYSGVHKVLQNLLAEKVSIRDICTILEAMLEACSRSRNIASVTEHVRSRLARQISEMFKNEQGYIPIVVLGPEWERSFSEAIVGDGEDRRLALAPSRLQEFVAALRNTFERHTLGGESPVLLVSGTVRPYVRALLDRIRPLTPVLSQNEIGPRARVRTIGQI
jgi:flagellar biosynthesis protein FlhA